MYESVPTHRAEQFRRRPSPHELEDDAADQSAQPADSAETAAHDFIEPTGEDFTPPAHDVVGQTAHDFAEPSTHDFIEPPAPWSDPQPQAPDHRGAESEPEAHDAATAETHPDASAEDEELIQRLEAMRSAIASLLDQVAEKDKKDPDRDA